MAQYVNGFDGVIEPGVYQLVYQSAAGTGQIEVSKDGGASWQVMTDGTFTTSEDRIAYLGGARYRITLTGDAKIWLDRVPT